MSVEAITREKRICRPNQQRESKKNIIAVGWNTCINMIVKGDSDD